jgi:hypothetical protein
MASAILTFLPQCGLESIPYLTPPVSLGRSANTFNVQKTDANDAEENPPEWQYRGIELYYKFYLPGDATELNLTELSQLQSRGFFRVSGPDDDAEDPLDKPLIDVSTLGDVSFLIDLDTLDVTRVSTSTVVVEPIRRGVPYDSFHPDYPSFKPFESEHFDKTDDDVGEELYTLIQENAGAQIPMVMYALSYGNRNYFADLYSEAICLGEIEINFGW